MTTSSSSPGDRRFLFLQGPHGPFFHRLARMLDAAGSRVWRVGFNAGDRAFWFGASGFIPYTDTVEAWPDALDSILTEHAITDIVLYGDTKPIHAEAVRSARARGLTVHVFEEGYLRPFWATYERGGSNGHSRLMDMTVADMRQALEGSDLDVPHPPGHWGDIRSHMFYGALYHWFILFQNGDYRNFRTHRDQTVAAEAWQYTRRLILMPWIWLGRLIATNRIRFAAWPYHLVLLQLEHDSSFRMHSPFSRQAEFLELVIDGFARGAPRHHHLVFKAHPLENGRSPLVRMIRDLALRYGIDGRVHFVAGGKLARLLDHARTAVTVNSTAGQQVLWRGIPLKVLGRAIYQKPEFVSDRALNDFFAQPGRPDTSAYRDFRRYLLETSQVPGGFYSARSRRALLRQVVDMMLADEDPYDALKHGKAAPRQPLHIVK